MVKNAKEKMKKVMVINKNIFYNLIRGACALVLALVFVSPAVADGDCANEDNDAINPAFAMCSTHAYNIGMETNPESSDRVAMQEVIGLKTTFFTQQLYKQYDQLESMVRRLKTQLKKAVMTSNLKAAGAQSEKDDGKNYSKEDYVQISGAKDCSSSWSNKEIFDCLAGNYNHIKSGDKSTAYKKQLQKDYKLACDTLGESSEDTKPCGAKDSCKANIKGNNDFTTCLSNLRTVIQKGKEAAADKEASRNNPWQQMMNNRD